jgi:hypothetical protein
MCNCKKKPRQEPQVIIPQTPEELHAKEMAEYIQKLGEEVQEDKQEN